MTSHKAKGDLKKESLLTFDAQRIIFVKDRNEGIYKARLGITNNSAEYVAIKVKTNATKVYTVQPNALKLAPASTIHLAMSSNLSIVEVRSI